MECNLSDIEHLSLTEDNILYTLSIFNKTKTTKIEYKNIICVKSENTSSENQILVFFLDENNKEKHLNIHFYTHKAVEEFLEYIYEKTKVYGMKKIIRPKTINEAIFSSIKIAKILGILFLVLISLLFITHLFLKIFKTIPIIFAPFHFILQCIGILPFMIILTSIFLLCILLAFEQVNRKVDMIIIEHIND